MNISPPDASCPKSKLIQLNQAYEPFPQGKIARFLPDEEPTRSIRDKPLTQTFVVHCASAEIDKVYTHREIEPLRAAIAKLPAIGGQH